MAIENFRILIPTNRSKFLKQICKFYQKQNLKVTVVHDFKMNKVLDEEVIATKNRKLNKYLIESYKEDERNIVKKKKRKNN